MSCFSLRARVISCYSDRGNPTPRLLKFGVCRPEFAFSTRSVSVGNANSGLESQSSTVSKYNM